MSDTTAKNIGYLEVQKIVQGPTMFTGMVTVSIILKDDQGRLYATHLVTRPNFFDATRKALGRLRPVGFPKPAPDRDPEMEMVKLERTNAEG